jgi:hypothetical protein
VLQVGLELDLLEGHGSGEQHVHELAVGGTCRRKWTVYLSFKPGTDVIF